MSPIDIAEFIDRRPVSAFQWSVIAICLSIGLLDGLDIQSIGVAAPAISKDWGLNPKDLTMTFSAAPAGMILGALALGPLADRFGRKLLIVAATFLFGLLTLLTARVTTLLDLNVLRFVTGLGLGGVLPNLIALVNEYSPNRLRGTISSIAFCGLPLGSLLGGLLARWAIPAFGWRSLFFVGGVIPVMIAAWAIWRLPESLRFLTLHPEENSTIPNIMKKIAPGEPIPSGAKFVMPEPSARKSSPRELFGPRRTSTTLLLSLSIGMNMFMLYFFINWLPTLLRTAGMTPANAIWGSVLVNGGGTLGAFSWGILIDRFGGFRAMSFAGIAAAAAIFLVGLDPTSKDTLLPALFVTGFCVLGAQIGLYSLIASVYPTKIRSSGVGWVLGLGRVGSVVGPAAGGWMLSLGWPISLIFASVAVPGLISATGIWLVGRLPRDFV